MPLSFDLTVQSGWKRLSSSADSAGVAAGWESDAGLFAYGIDLSAQPWRQLAVQLGYARGSTRLETAIGTLTPRRTDVTWWELELLAGWRLALDLGPLREVTPLAGYGRERWASDHQHPTQATPSWSHSELRLGANAGLSFLDGALPVSAGLFLAPLVSVDEDFSRSGKNPGGWGLDLSARADYDLGAMFGRFGSLSVGGEVGWGGRFISYDGIGTRFGADLATRMEDVEESYSRVSAMLFVTWRHAASDMPALVAPTPAPAPKKSSPKVHES